MSLESLHRELILQHYRSPRNRGRLTAPTTEASVGNPVCGDEVTLQLEVVDGRIAAARFSGQGCSVSQASASMMTHAIEGLSIEEVRDLAGRFRRLVRGDPEAARDPALGDLRALAGVARFPARVRCALLPWTALDEAEKALATRDGSS